MPSYVYKVRDATGNVLKGQIEASNEKELRKKLDERNFFIIEYDEYKVKKIASLGGVGPLFKSVSYQDLSVFSWQLFTLLDAGLTLVASIRLIIHQTKNEALRYALSRSCQRVEEGATFADALKEHPKIFSRFFYQMVNAGEVSGVLDEMLKRVAVYYERQSEVQAKVNAALIYPCLLLLTSLGVIYFLIVYVLPAFANIFAEIGASIPAPTRILLTLSVAVKNFGPLLLLIPAGLIVFVKIIASTNRGRYQVDRLVMKLPGIGGLINKAITTQFTQTLATLVGSGIPILTALAVVTDTINNRVLVRLLKKVSLSVESGKPLAQPIEESRILPEMVSSMIRVGEETGSLEKMLDKIADFYHKEVYNAIESFTKLIEPVLMIFMASLIGYIALAIFLPLSRLLQVLR